MYVCIPRCVLLHEFVFQRIASGSQSQTVLFYFASRISGLDGENLLES